MNVSEYVWQRLSEWGLRRVYGYPGDGVGGLDVALEKAKEYEDPPLAHGATHTGVGYAGPAKLPDEALLRAAADVLNSGKKVAMLLGPGRSRRPTRSSRWRSGCRRVSPRRCSARPRFLT